MHEKKLNSAISMVIVAILSVAALAAAGCQDKTTKETFPSVGYEVLETFGQHAVSHYAEVVEQAEQLHTATRNLCEEGDDEALDDAKDHYDSARQAWLENRAFAFGPEVEVPQRLGPKIDWQPPKYDDIDELLDDESELLKPSLLSAHLRGFSPIEYLLYGERSSDLMPDSRACDYLLLITEDLIENTETLYDVWSPEGENYVSVLNQSGGSSELFDSSHDALSAIVNRMGYVIENLRDRELRDPMGASGDAFRPELIVSRVSQRSLQDLRDTVSGIESLAMGRGAHPGLVDYASALGFEYRAELEQRFDEIAKAIDALEPSLERAFERDEAGVAELDEALENLQLFFQIQVIGELSLSQIFNDADGD